MKQSATKWVLGHKVTPCDVTGDYDFVLGETPAKVQGPPPHSHAQYNETFLITEGEMEFMINGDIKTYKAGDFIDLPPNTVHTFNNSSDAVCKWVNIHSPKGFRSFFETLGVPIEEADSQMKSVAEDKIKLVIETAANYDMLLKL
ncbi:MAG: cupin domain-containing protein [Algicola sp.]|nr:cupin domain-containing protein [Algicola sp.]